MNTSSVLNITPDARHVVLPLVACGVGRLDHALKHAKKRVRQRNKIGRPAFIYLIECHDYVKVGIADDVKSRMMSLQMGCPYELRVLVVFKVAHAEAAERRLHALWKPFGVRGEWFRVPAGLLASAVNAERFDDIFTE